MNFMAKQNKKFRFTWMHIKNSNVHIYLMWDAFRHLKTWTVEVNYIIFCIFWVHFTLFCPFFWVRVEIFNTFHSVLMKEIFILKLRVVNWNFKIRFEAQNWIKYHLMMDVFAGNLQVSHICPGLRFSYVSWDIFQIKSASAVQTGCEWNTTIDSITPHNANLSSHQ